MLHSRNAYSKDHYAFFITCTVVEWLPLFPIEPYRNAILDSLRYLTSHKPAELNAYVLMPSHLHAILWPHPNARIGDVLRDFKRFTSRAISRLAETRGEIDYLRAFRRARQAGRSQETSTYQVWQEGSHPEAIYSPGFARQKLEYIHNNPVKAGLVTSPTEWPYSSARDYLLGEESVLPVSLLPL
ncbi:MAG: transposase [Chloroflexi bacterium]|nr:transposase [Chloroflexota bacterium]